MALEERAGSIRTHIVEQAKDKSDKAFFDGVINQFLTENDANLMPQLTEIIRVLVDIDPEYADDSSLGLPVGAPFSVVLSSRFDPDAGQFLDLFCTQYCSTLVAPVLQLMKCMFLIQTRLCRVVAGLSAEVEGRSLCMHSLTKTRLFGYSIPLASTSLDRPSSARCANICKLMSFLIQQHPTRTKVLLSSSRLVEKICILLRNKEKHLRLSKLTSHVRSDLCTFVIQKKGHLTSALFCLCFLVAIKFFRTCLGLEDDYFNRILIKNKVIHGIVSVLQDTNGKNDLLNSVCLEFFSFIRDVCINMFRTCWYGTLEKLT